MDITTTFSIPDWIDKGLKSQVYERVGGVIRDSQTKQIVAMLLETTPSSTPSTILSQFGSVASILNLGFSVIGFTLLNKRLGEIEERLKYIQEELDQLHSKFDLSVYANFRAALDLGRDAFTMTKLANRVNMANLAINRFLEAQHTYTGYFDTALAENIQVADEYLSSLFLTYVARTRCYLELEEVETARSCLQEGAEVLRSHVEKYIDKVSPYIQKNVFPPGTIPLSVHGVTSGVIASSTVGDVVVPVIPVIQLGLLGGLLGVNSKKEENPPFPQAREKVGVMIENYHRFEAYQAEVHAIAQLGISLHEWLKLTTSTEVKPDRAELLYIIPSKPLDLKLSS